MVEYFLMAAILIVVAATPITLSVKGVRAQMRNLDERAKAQQTGRVYVFTNRPDWSRGRHSRDTVIIWEAKQAFGIHPTVHDRIFIEGDPDIGYPDGLLFMFEKFNIEQNTEKSKMYGESVFPIMRANCKGDCRCNKSAEPTPMPKMSLIGCDEDDE